MFAEERHVRIVEWINQHGKATVAELSEQLNVSTVTIRRDLEKLEENHELIRTHGGAISNQLGTVEVGRERSFSEKEESLIAEKKRIAEAAAALVNKEEAIMLTPGSTNMYVAKRLVDHQSLMVVTNAANIATFMLDHSDNEVILIGGKMRRKSYAMVGPLAELALQKIRVDKLFVGVDGLDLQEGLTTPNISEASVNRLMMNVAKQVIVVADHTKFGCVMLAHIASLDAVQMIITDNKLNHELAEQIRERGIQLLLV